MTRWNGETDLDREGQTRREDGTSGTNGEPGEQERRRDSGCTSEELKEGTRLNCKRASLGGGKVIYENIVVIGRAPPAIACLSNVP